MENTNSNKNNNLQKIRNFSIIAHIDHGKSTLADRMLEKTGTVSMREMKDRLLDTLEIEREKGITIKLQTVRMNHKYGGNDERFKGQGFILNLIDTPGHVDFSYEVSRSLAASEGAVLLVDATQGIQAQTITTIYKALEYDLTIIPVINKIDLPSAQVQETIDELKATFGFTENEILKVSGKTGMGVLELLDNIVEQVPEPTPVSEDQSKALIFDSFYDEHKGVIALAKNEGKSILSGQKIRFFQSETIVQPIEIGYLTPAFNKVTEILPGEVCYIATGLKDIRQIHVGDTITTEIVPENFAPLDGYKQPKPMVFASLYPVEADEFENFQEGLMKLALNDASLSFQKEHSSALGTGFMCGFLGLLHLEITLERLNREFDLDLISTTPSVEYLVHLGTKDISKLGNVNIANIDNGILKVKKAAEFPEPTLIEKVQEPWSKLEIVSPDTYIGPIMDLASRNRASFLTMEYVTGSTEIRGRKHVILKFEIPTAEILTSFFDSLKSATQGYASMDYEFINYRDSDIVKVGIMVNYQPVEALSFLTNRVYAENRGRTLVDKLKDIIPKQQFKVALQASIGGKVIARETINAFRKDVLAKLYGGDVTRKKKLLEKQKKGKKRLKTFGNVEIPQEAFLAALKN